MKLASVCVGSIAIGVATSAAGFGWEVAAGASVVWALLVNLIAEQSQ